MNAMEHQRMEQSVPISSDREFGLVMASVMFVIAIWPFVLTQGDVRYGAVAVSILLALLALFIPKALHPFNRVWGKLGEILHKLVTPIVMGILFFAVVTPIAMLMRLSGKRPLNLKFNPDVSTYWLSKEHPEQESMKHQF